MEIAAEEAGAAGEAAMGGPESWWLMRQEADEAQEVKVIGAFISSGLFEDVWDVWDVEEDVGDLGWDAYEGHARLSNGWSP